MLLYTLKDSNIFLMGNKKVVKVIMSNINELVVFKKEFVMSIYFHLPSLIFESKM